MKITITRVLPDRMGGYACIYFTTDVGVQSHITVHKEASEEELRDAVSQWADRLPKFSADSEEATAKFKHLEGRIIEV